MQRVVTNAEEGLKKEEEERYGIFHCLDLEKITLSPRRKLGIQNRDKREVFTTSMLEILRMERSM